MTKQNFFIGLAVVLAVVVIFLGLTRTKAGENLGDTITNSQWFAGGAAIGAIDLTQNNAQIIIPAGSNQAQWCAPKNVLIDSAEVAMTGTASSTYNVNVGTTTAGTQTAVFNITTSPFWSQLIANYNVATGTVPQAGITSVVVTDNVLSHKASYPSKLQVLAGQCVTAMVTSFCTADGACNTATSSARGWSALTTTFFYHYKGSD